ncbi:SHOCT domain-containing protein [Halorubrum sp. DTA98]|uniref:SHOCT domain-containing protein n=1 Tax=Halorubrum sp. DTA98 TaxID=3402163 RepID=UPI003AAF5615
MSSSDRLDATTIVLLLLVVIVLFPLFTMGFGFGGMMGSGGMMGWGGTTSGWWPLVGLIAQLVFLLVLLGGGYLIFRRMTDAQSSHDPALEELRMAYARGDLTEEEFESRRETLERSE